jgi:hypothetical protein
MPFPDSYYEVNLTATRKPSRKKRTLLLGKRLPTSAFLIFLGWIDNDREAKHKTSALQ